MKTQIIKTKHNKKRNTVFLYEAMMQEITKCIVNNDIIQKSTIVSLFKEHFSKNSLLRKELDLYLGILESKNLKENIAEKILNESKNQYSNLDKYELFNEQTKLLASINSRLSPSVFSNFVGNYKSLATISQIFNQSLAPKDRIIMEQFLIKKMCSKLEEEQDLKPLDDLVFSTFIKKFNNKYTSSLLKEQQQLLSHYIMSFSEDTSLKYFLNEELERIKTSLATIVKQPEFVKDLNLKQMTEKLEKKLETFQNKPFDQTMLAEILSIQEFISEASK